MRIKHELPLVIALAIASTGQSAPSLRDRLTVAAMAVSQSIDGAFRAEDERLSALCNGRPGCKAANLRPQQIKLASLVDRPGGTRTTATIYAVSRIRSGESGGYTFEELAIALQVERTDRPGRIATWMDDVGDWSYGIWVSGVPARGEWVQLTGPPFPPNAWMPLHGESMDVLDVSPLQGEIVGLDPLRARWPN